MKFVLFKYLSPPVLSFCAVFAVIAQSADQNFPTPIATNEIVGTVKARDVGDPRLTTYFYAFNGSQGDIFINVVTRNFSGDIDIFNADGLQPLTKMVLYADAGITETGRLVYLRKPEKLLLRIEGRSPNDDAATFRIKFGGSFVALTGRKTEDAPKVESLGEVNESGVRVNSVGTIIEVVPKPQKTKKVVADAGVSETGTSPKEKKAEEQAVAETPAETPPVKTEETKTDETKSDTVFENSAAKVTVEPSPKSAAKRPARTTTRTTKVTKAPPKKAASPPAEKKPDPLASIRLIVQLKDGEVIERPMSEVLRFNVVNGVLTVTGKDGKVVKYSILDVAKVTIE